MMTYYCSVCGEKKSDKDNSYYILDIQSVSKGLKSNSQKVYCCLSCYVKNIGYNFEHIWESSLYGLKEENGG